jgi:DNA-binding MarR family transcriptional regulator
MTRNEFSELRDKEQIILQQISSGNDDVQKITSATTLENHHVTYAFQKLEEIGYVEVSKPEGTVERVINGQRRVFQHPKQADLTEKGKQILEKAEKQDLYEYEDLSHRELVEKTHELEDRVDKLENKIKTIRDQVHRIID